MKKKKNLNTLLRGFLEIAQLSHALKEQKNPEECIWRERL